MREQLKNRLEELKSELDTGQKARVELEQQLTALQQKLIYISGAIKVLEEELDKAAQQGSAADQAQNNGEQDVRHH